MSIRTVTFAPGEFYHVYNRGVEKRQIFLDAADHRRFTELLYVANTTQPTDLRTITRQHNSVYDWDRGDPLVAIGAYCLMPNHFHLLLTPVVEQGISQFMNKLGTSYSMYFNRRYTRTGALFEGKFKAQHATSDEYLKYLYSYIHLNPVKLQQPDWKERGMDDPEAAYHFACNYQYSSLPDVLGQSRPERALLNPAPFPAYFYNQVDLQTELFDWLQYAALVETEAAL